MSVRSCCTVGASIMAAGVGGSWGLRLQSSSRLRALARLNGLVVLSLLGHVLLGLVHVFPVPRGGRIGWD